MGQRKCKCPIWVNGRVRGEAVRRSLKTRNWEAAARIVREWDELGKEKALGFSVKEACDRFYADCVAQRLSDSSLRKYNLLCTDLKIVFGSREIGSVSLDDIRAYREGWTIAPITARKRIERLRTFFRFCNEAGWVQSNPAKLLKMPQGRGKPVVAFSDEEMERIIWATEIYPDSPPGRRAQMRAFVFVLRYSGLRIGDAVGLRRKNINEDGKLFLRTMKSGANVWFPLPSAVTESLANISKLDEYFFWSGLNLRSCISNWQRALKTLFRLAGVEGGHAHRFRHSFVKTLLVSKVSIENVAVLLGHSSSRITTIYAEWVKERQEALETDVKRVVWK